MKTNSIVKVYLCTDLPFERGIIMRIILIQLCLEFNLVFVNMWSLESMIDLMSFLLIF
jgi:hypothetical protein